MPMWS